MPSPTSASFSIAVLAAGFFALCPLQPCAASAADSWREEVERLAQPLRDDADLDKLIDAAGKRRLVLLGEASHGTREFYTWRDTISRRLIAEKDFSFIAVEGDWAAIQHLNAYVKHHPESASSAEEVLIEFDRWPTWMWANEEIVALAEWLRTFNRQRPPDRRVGFHGIDLYGPWDSMRQVVAFFDAASQTEARRVREHYSEWARYDGDPQRYARAVFAFLPTAEAGVQNVVDKLRAMRPANASPEWKAWFEAKQNAKVVKNAELHFRSMVEEGPASWNARAGHMKRTVERLLDFYGPNARGIVWAHNTHVGDARATEAAERGEVNIGHLAREKFGPPNVFIAGFGAAGGKVVAGRAWGGEREIMSLPVPPPESVEGLLRDAHESDFWILFDDGARDGALAQRRGHRAIGVVYRPEAELLSNYVQTILPARYDAFLFLHTTSPLRPLH